MVQFMVQYHVNGHLVAMQDVFKADERMTFVDLVIADAKPGDMLVRQWSTHYGELSSYSNIEFITLIDPAQLDDQPPVWDEVSYPMSLSGDNDDDTCCYQLHLLEGARGEMTSTDSSCTGSDKTESHSD